ncbi:RHS repeat-associated core domain-containing protein [Burkholderia sp. LMG 21824]|uniref:RHS repeat-associated core domain-containing protein n=1 Tax=Burkholderia sp. LMG 21824 TaxID=3158172 RepID=UPI003C2D4F6F
MALLAVKHLDPVVGVDVHSVLVTPGTPPVFLPHPHVGFMLDKREYIQAAKAVVGCIATMIAQEKVTEYVEDHPEEVKKLEHLADEANQQVNKQLNDLMGGGKFPDVKDDPTVAEGMKLANEADKIKNRISDDLGSNVGSGGSSGRPIFVNGMMRATAGTHAYHVPGLHFPLGESFAPPPEEVEPSNDGESFMGSKTVLANNDPMSYMALEALSCWSIGMEPPPHNSAHTDRTYPSMPSSVMLPIPAGRPVLVGGPPIMNMAAAAKGLFKAFQGSKWAKALADKLHLKSGFLRCNVLRAEPVDAMMGDVVVQQRDFTVFGRLPLNWERQYSSQNQYHGAVGAGWQTPADIRLELMRHDDEVGVLAYFPDHATAFDTMPDAAGWSARVYDWQNGHVLYQRNDRLILRTRAGIEYEFPLLTPWQHAVAALSDDATLVLPVERIANLINNAWAFKRRTDGSLACLVEWKGNVTTGRKIECETSQHGLIAGAANLLTKLTLIDQDGIAHPLVQYEHDRNGNLTAVLDAMSQPRRFAYADGCGMVRHTSARGVSFHYSYLRHNDDRWRVNHAWGDNGLFDYRFIYDIEHWETRITDSLGHTTILYANERGMPVAQIDPLGGITSYRYDMLGRANAKIDPVGRTSTWMYDAFGNLLTLTLPDGSIVRAQYDSDHRLICMTDPNDGVWRYTWDERGNLLDQTTPAQASSKYDYDTYGQIVSYTNPRGAVTRFGYDYDGNLTQVIDALNHGRQYTYDARANLIQVINALGQVSRYEYDRNGNLTRVSEPGGRETFCNYDADGNMVSCRDPNGQITQLEYSPLGQVTRRLAPDGSTVEYRYNTEEKLVGVVNERGELYQLNRDALGRIVEEIDYWEQPCRYEYGAAGDLLRSINALGQVVNYESDPLGRVVKKHVPDPQRPEGTRTETFSYDRSGNLVVAENPECRIELRYDSAGRVVEEKQGNEFVIASMYDAAGNRTERRTQLVSSDGVVDHVVFYEYNVLDAVTSIRIDSAPPVNLERDAVGQIRVEHLGAALRRELSYTSEGLPATQALFFGTGPMFSSEYTYDANGELLEKRDSRLGIERYQYDLVGRLTGHLDPTNKLHRFRYDPTGDLLSTRIRRHGHSSRFDEVSQVAAWIREGEHDGCYYGFDSIGNLIRRQDQQQDLTLLWDGDGLLVESRTTRVCQTSALMSRSGTVNIRTRYGYDALRRRTKKITEIRRNINPRKATESGWTTLYRTSSFFWDGNMLVSEVRNGNGSIDMQPSQTSGPLHSAEDSSGNVEGLTTEYPESTQENREVREWVYYPQSLVPLVTIQHPYVTAAPALLEHGGSSQYYFCTDPNGFPVRVIDSIGAVVWEVNYTPPGDIKLVENRTDFYQPIRFQGQYYDAESGLHYNRHRYYDSHNSSFISKDRIGLAGNLNLYQFLVNSLGWIDPLGLTEHRGRIQAQGDNLEKSFSWAQDTPITANAALEGLNDLEASLSKSDRKIRENEFRRARKFIKNAERAGGVDAPVSKTFQVKDTKHERVDIEVNAGKAFIPEEEEKTGGVCQDD